MVDFLSAILIVRILKSAKGFLFVFSKFSQFQNDPPVKCRNRTFSLSLAVDVFLKSNGYSFEIDDIINVLRFLEILPKFEQRHSVKTKVALLSAKVRFSFNPSTVLLRQSNSVCLQKCRYGNPTHDKTLVTSRTGYVTRVTL